MREVKPTQKPVPSSDIKDLFFNSGLLDIWATSLELKYIDRFGNCHLTAAGMEWIFNELVTKFKIESEQALLAAGYAPAGTFQEGAEVVSRNGTVLWKLPDGDGDHYRWDGDLPKPVPAGSTPQSTGGIGKGAWVSVGDASLRTELISNKGFLLVGGQEERFHDLRAFVEAGDPPAPDYTQAFKRAIASGKGRVFVNVPVKFTENITIPKGFRVDIGECGYLYANTATVRVEGFINSIGGNDPYRGYIHPFEVDSSTVPGIYTMPVELKVPEDYPTIQSAIEAIPNNYWQRIVISIASGSYNENIVVRSKRGCTPLFLPSPSQQANIRIASRTGAPSDVSVLSAQIFNCGGTPYSPSLEQINFTNRTHSDEDASIEFYGCTSGGVYGCSFIGVGVDKCIEAYNSTISVESPDFGDKINGVGLVTKHGGVINYNSTQLGNLPPSKGVLNKYVAQPIGGIIIGSDFSPVIGLVAQTYSDGVMAGFVTEESTKTITGVNWFSRMDVTRYHTFFENYDKFTNSTALPADTMTYFPMDGLYMQAASSGGSVRHRVIRQHRLRYQYENQNYRAFSIAVSVNLSLVGMIISGSFESGNYFGFRVISGGEIKGVVSVDGVETTISLPSQRTKSSWTVKYNGKGNGVVQFFNDGILSGYILDRKCSSLDGTILDSRVSSGSMTMHEFEFVSSN